MSGEVIEQHRKELGAQLKNDLQSYLDYSKDNNELLKSTGGYRRRTDTTSIKSISEINKDTQEFKTTMLNTGLGSTGRRH